MAYTEEGEEYTYFTEEEEALIDGWLEKHGYEWDRATVCGSCCGFYNDEYWVGGIGGNFKEKDREAFEKFAKRKEIPCTIQGNDIRASS